MALISLAFLPAAVSLFLFIVFLICAPLCGRNEAGTMPAAASSDENVPLFWRVIQLVRLFMHAQQNNDTRTQRNRNKNEQRKAIPRCLYPFSSCSALTARNNYIINAVSRQRSPSDPCAIDKK